MPKIKELKDVTDDELDELVSDFESEGATVQKTKQSNGLWTVTATYPDHPAAKPAAKPVKPPAKNP